MTDLITPSFFVCKSADLDLEVINGAATNVAAIGTTVLTGAEDASTSWSGLAAPGVFETPDQDAVYALMDPAVAGATTMEGVTSRVSAAIETYATELAAIKPDLEDLEKRATDFRLEALAGYEVSNWEARGTFGNMTTGPDGNMVPLDDANETTVIPWREHGPAVEANQGYVDEYNAIIERISTVAVTCATAIQAELTMVCAAPATVITAEALAAQPEVSTWGTGVEEDRNCTESVGHGFANFGTGIWTGVQGLGGHDAATGEQSFGVAGRSWLGVGDFLLSTVMVTSPAMVPMALLPGPGGDFVRDRVNVAATGWGSLIGWDHQAALAGEDGWHKWEEDGVAAFTESAANIGTFFIPVAGTGAAVGKTALTGTRVGALVVRVGTHVGEFAIPGGSHVVAATVRVVDLGANGLKGGWRGLVEGISTAPVRPSVVPGVVNAAAEVPMLPPRAPVSESLGLDAPPPRADSGGSHPATVDAPTVPESTAGPGNPAGPDAAPGPQGADSVPHNKSGGASTAHAPDGGATHDRHGRPFVFDDGGRRHLRNDPEGTYRDTNGALHDEVSNSFVRDPNKPETVGDVQMAERGETTHPVLDETAQAEHAERVQERAELQTASNAAHQRLNELADRIGIDPRELRRSEASVRRTLSQLLDEGVLTERQLERLTDAANDARQTRVALTGASRELAEQIADAVAATHGRTTLIDALDSVGRDRLDYAAIGISADGNVVFTVSELKGGNAQLGTRTVDGVDVQQGTTAYLRDLLETDPRVLDSLREYLSRSDADILIADAIRRGEVRVEYNLVDTKPNGAVNETSFTIDPITLPPLS